VQPELAPAFKEFPAPDEPELAEAILALMQREMVKTAGSGTTLRDVHSKHHGCVRAVFRVDSQLPQEFHAGVFQPGKEYEAWIRFSNAGAFAPVGGVGPDTERDVRGLAIKLLDVPGPKLLDGEEGATCQDFLLFTAPKFLGAGPRDFLELMEAVISNKLVLGWFLLTHPRMTVALLQSLKKHTSLLENRYFSCVPYALGPIAVKYALQPRTTKRSSRPAKAGPDFLRETLVRELAEGDAVFDFTIQIRTHPEQMSLEDGLAIWDESVSPYRKVATLTIPRQTFDSPDQMNHCEHSSFNPWRTLAEHRPLGGINRVRRIVYRTISAFRHGRNNAPQWEPPTSSSPSMQ
jgi:hypothetical protein